MSFLKEENILIKKNNDLFKLLKNNYLESTFSHSTLIYGDKGIGKSTFVKMFVKNIFNNFSKNNNNLTNIHNKLIESNSHPNFKIITKLIDEKSKKMKKYITIDQIRNLESFIYQSSFYKLPKIILIDTADELGINSSNSLLKILEEPKKNTFFFLISNQPSKLLSTIRSRCIKFKFKKPSFDDFKIIVSLHNDHLDEDEEIKYLFDLSNGSPGIALELYFQEAYGIFDKIINICTENKILSSNILEFSSETKKYHDEQYEIFLMMIKFILSNIIKLGLGINIKKQFSSKIVEKLQLLSQLLTSSSCFKVLNYINDNENDLFILNLDKKIFTINIFSEMATN